MELRDYQKELLNEVMAALDEGCKAPCVVLPCGGGKSVILAEIAKIYTHSDKRVLFLVHRKELCAQIFSTFVRYGVRMENCDIEMVQTVSRHLKQQRHPDLIITDENHHSLAKTYKRIYKHFSDVPRVGVTATPERLDGSGLYDVNDILIIGKTAKWLIENSYLAPYSYFAPLVEMPKFRTSHGEFIQSDVADYFNRNKSKIYGDVISHYKRLADGKKAICYLPTVEFSKQTAAEFTSSGIPAAHIDGTTPKTERDDIIAKFRSGEIQILCNVDIVSEGFDVPDCECAILLRPTKSLTLFIQQSMRCMRYAPGKKAIIIDHVDNIRRHGFPDAEREWLLEGHPKKKRSSEMPVKICPWCGCAVHLKATVCPQCGKPFEVEESTLQKVEAELVDVTENPVQYYLTPSECRNVEELKEYARLHHYKPGWVYYQQKNRGWLHERRDKNSKRYPCRAVKGWTC